MNSNYNTLNLPPSTSIFKIFVNIILPLVIGTLIYAFFRGIPLINMQALSDLNPPQFIIYNVPDALWFYALLSSVIFIWEYKASKNFIGWFVFVVLLCLLSEIFQLMKLIPGTFDYKDLIVYIITGLLSLLQLKKSYKSYYSKQKLTL